MSKRQIARWAAAAGVVVLAAPASAQWWDRPPVPYGYYDAPPGYWAAPGIRYGYAPPAYGYRRPLPPDAIVDRLEDADYERVGRPLFNGETYTVDATDPSGRRVRLVLDAYRGVILGRHRPGAPVAGPVPEMAPVPEAGPSRAARPSAPRRREAARTEPSPALAPPAAGALPAGALPAPADPRLAPRPGEARPAEGRPAEARPPVERKKREAVRTEPGKPGGLNPGSPSPGGDRPAAPAPRAPAPQAVTPPAAPAKPSEAAADPVRQERPVRVIQGPTPLQPSANPNAGAQSQLENLPAPPPVPSATGTN